MSLFQMIRNEETTVNLDELAVKADIHAFEIWGDELARGEPVPVADNTGHTIAYAFPFIIGARIFPKLESIKDLKNRTDFHFGTVFVAANGEAYQILRVLNIIHPVFLDREAIQKISYNILGPDANLIRIIWLGWDEYIEIATENRNLFLDIRTYNEVDPDIVLKGKPQFEVIDHRLVTDKMEIFPETKPLGEGVEAFETPVYKLVPRANCVPVVNWTWWCVPTAFTMATCYWDNFVKGEGGIQGYGRLVNYWFDHPTSKHNVPDFIDQLIDPQTGTWRAGFQNFSDFLKKTYGYNFSTFEVKADVSTNWAWQQIRAEIDAGRPFVWSVEGHATCALGYRVASDGKRYVVIHTTWGDTRQEQLQEWIYTKGLGMAVIHPGGGTIGQDVAIGNPDGGEILYTNLPYRIQWHVWGNQIRTAELSYSLDGGNTWKTIVETAPCNPGNNIYDWTPQYLTDRGRIRIRCRDNAGVIIAGDGSLQNIKIIAGPRQVSLKTILIKTKTNDTGFFSAKHGLERYTPDGYSIHGVSVAVQHLNGNWHTLELCHTVDNRFWWNNDVVQGVINSQNFYDRPVKILVFTESVPG